MALIFLTPYWFHTGGYETTTSAFSVAVTGDDKIW